MFKNKVIDKYFLEAACPYTKRRPIKIKTILWLAGGSFVAFIFGVIFLGNNPESKDVVASVPDYTARTSPSALTSNDGIAMPSASNSQGLSRQSTGFGSGLGIGYGGGGLGGGGSGRNRSANQVIRRGEGGNDPMSRLPMGYGVSVRLLNAILSTDSSTPVIAEVTEDVYAHGTLSIPASTRAIGNASYDDSSRRIQLRFHTFVYPDGDQHQVQAIGLMADGSAGLSGEYQSGETKRQIGRFLGNFIGGFADGMKERQAAGQSGLPYEPGSIRNGVLNGVTLSAADQGKSYSEGLGQTKPMMSLSANQSFILFLEKEYSP